MKAKEIKERRAELAKKVRELADKANAESRDLTPEESQSWNEMNGEFDALGKQLMIQERADKNDAEMAASKPAESLPGRENYDGREEGEREDRSSRSRRVATDKDRALALQAWMVQQCDRDLSDKQIEAAEACGVRLNRREISIRLSDRAPQTVAEARALSAVDGSAGGFTVPEGFVPRLETALLTFGGMRQVAEIQRTENGQAVEWPMSDDTGNTGEQVGENAAVTEQDIAFTSARFSMYLFSSKMIKVPVVLLQDSAFNLANYLADKLGERIGRIQNTKFTTGLGNATVKGLMAASTSGKTSASSTAIKADEIIDLIHSVDAAYRVGARFMMHDNIVLAIRKLKDGEGRYIWQDANIGGGIPTSLLGYPVTINQDMDSTVESTKKTIVFGQLSKYVIREIPAIRLRRLVERYAENDQEAFIAFARADGNLLDAGTHPVKHLTQV